MHILYGGYKTQPPCPFLYFIAHNLSQQLSGQASVHISIPPMHTLDGKSGANSLMHMHFPTGPLHLLTLDGPCLALHLWSQFSQEPAPKSSSYVSALIGFKTETLYALVNLIYIKTRVFVPYR